MHQTDMHYSNDYCIFDSREGDVGIAGDEATMDLQNEEL